MAFKAIYGNPLQDPKSDYQSAVKIGNIRFGKDALYIPAFPVGAQQAILAAGYFFLYRSNKARCTEVLPVPGPPVITQSLLVRPILIASLCSGARRNLNARSSSEIASSRSG